MLNLAENMVSVIRFAGNGPPRPKWKEMIAKKLIPGKPFSFLHNVHFATEGLIIFA